MKTIIYKTDQLFYIASILFFSHFLVFLSKTLKESVQYCLVWICESVTSTTTASSTTTTATTTTEPSIPSSTAGAFSIFLNVALSIILFLILADFCRRVIRKSRQNRANENYEMNERPIDENSPLINQIANRNLVDEPQNQLDAMVDVNLIDEPEPIPPPSPSLFAKCFRRKRNPV